MPSLHRDLFGSFTNVAGYIVGGMFAASNLAPQMQVAALLGEAFALGLTPEAMTRLFPAALSSSVLAMDSLTFVGILVHNGFDAQLALRLYKQLTGT